MTMRIITLVFSIITLVFSIYVYIRSRKMMRKRNDHFIDTSNMPHIEIETLHMDAYKWADRMVCTWLEDHYGYNINCLVKMKLWSPTDEEPSIITSVWMANSSGVCWSGEWLNDWWKGRTRVEILGILPLYKAEVPENHHAVWMGEDILVIHQKIDS